MNLGELSGRLVSKIPPRLRRGRWTPATRLGFWVLLLAAWIAALPCDASIFGKEKPQPAPQWAVDAAKTPTPATAKDANAVILFDEYLMTVDGQGRAVEREHQATRILKPQGREWAECGASYDVDEKIDYLRVWTILPDGKQLQAMESDFHEVGYTQDSILLETEKSRIAMGPGADPGAVVVCESEVQLRSYIDEKLWHLQFSIPVVSEALEVDLPPGRAHTDAWHNYAPVKPTEVAPNHWRWELTQVPALILRDIPATPDWYALAARMSVQWGDAAVVGRDNQWRAIGQWFDQLEAHRPDPTPEIVAKTHELTDGVPDYYQKLARVADYVQRNIRYFVIERGIGGHQAHPAGDIFRYKYGDCKDKATIVISMLQVAGIQAYYVPVDHRRGFVDPALPSAFGDHMISAIEVPADVRDERLQAIVKAANGKRYLIFDPTDERTPVGYLRPDLQGSYGLLVAGADSQVFQLPVLAPSASGSERKGEFKLDADGTLSGSVDIARMGAEGGNARLRLKRYDEKELHDELEQSLGGDIPGVSLEKYKYDEPAALDKPVSLHYEVTAHQYGHMAGPLMLVRPRVVATYAYGFNRKPRTLPIDLRATGHWHDSYDIQLPDGFVVDEIPDPVNLDLDFASYHSTVSSKGKILHYEREYTVKQVELPAEKQPEFLRLEGVIRADETATVVLKRQ